MAIREGRALDLVEIDAASNRGINDVRELRDRLNYAPTDLRRKVYILDEAHQITRDAWNALLKSLEEPPEFVTFMFASTHPQDFPPAILSRLQRFDVRRLTVPEITGKLERILAADGREADPEAIAVVAGLAAGGMRDAESILDQLLSSTGGRIEAEAVRDLLGLAEAELVDGFVTALASGDAAAGIALLDRLEERGRDLRVFLDQVVDALRERLLAGLVDGPGRGPRHRGRRAPARGDRSHAARRRRPAAPAGARAVPAGRSLARRAALAAPAGPAPAPARAPAREPAAPTPSDGPGPRGRARAGRRARRCPVATDRSPSPRRRRGARRPPPPPRDRATRGCRARPAAAPDPAAARSAAARRHPRRHPRHGRGRRRRPRAPPPRLAVDRHRRSPSATAPRSR